MKYSFRETGRRIFWHLFCSLFDLFLFNAWLFWQSIGVKQTDGLKLACFTSCSNDAIFSVRFTKLLHCLLQKERLSGKNILSTLCAIYLSSILQDLFIYLFGIVVFSTPSTKLSFNSIFIPSFHFPLFLSLSLFLLVCTYQFSRTDNLRPQTYHPYDVYIIFAFQCVECGVRSAKCEVWNAECEAYRTINENIHITFDSTNGFSFFQWIIVMKLSGFLFSLFLDK